VPGENPFNHHHHYHHRRRHHHHHHHHHHHLQGFLCDGTRWYSIPGNENEDCIIKKRSSEILADENRTFFSVKVKLQKNFTESEVFSEIGGI